MSSELIRWSGLAAMLSGVVWIMQSLLALVVSDPSEALWLDALFIIGVLPRWCGVGLILGLPASIALENYGAILTTALLDRVGADPLAGCPRG